MVFDSEITYLPTIGVAYEQFDLVRAHQQMEGSVGGVCVGPVECSGVWGAPIRNIIQR